MCESVCEERRVLITYCESINECAQGHARAVIENAQGHRMEFRVGRAVLELESQKGIECTVGAVVRVQLQRERRSVVHCQNRCLYECACS